MAGKSGFEPQMYSYTLVDKVPPPAGLTLLLTSEPRKNTYTFGTFKTASYTPPGRCHLTNRAKGAKGTPLEIRELDSAPVPTHTDCSDSQHIRCGEKRLSREKIQEEPGHEESRRTIFSVPAELFTDRIT